jgi:hypothetical protein
MAEIGSGLFCIDFYSNGAAEARPVQRHRRRK